MKVSAVQLGSVFERMSTQVPRFENHKSIARNQLYEAGGAKPDEAVIG